MVRKKLNHLLRWSFYFKGCMIRLYNIQFGYKLLKTFDIPKSYNVQHGNLREFWEKIIVMPLLWQVTKYVILKNNVIFKDSKMW